MEKPKPSPSLVPINICGADKNGKLHPWRAFDKRNNLFWGGPVIPQIGPMPSPEPNSKRYSL